MSIEKHSLPDVSAAIYGETANLNYFLKTPLTPDSADSVTNQVQSVSQHSRKMYSGSSTSISVKAHSRTVIQDPGRRNGNATPGKEMILDDGVERRAFTFTGSFTEVHAHFVGDAKMDLFIYSPSARYSIAAAGAQVASIR